MLIKFICPICQEQEVDKFLEAPMPETINTKIKLCVECKKKVVEHNENHKDDRICEICGFPVETEDEWVRICELCQEDIIVHNHSLDIRAADYFTNTDGLTFFKRKRKGEKCKIKCVDCGCDVEVEVCNTKTERCVDCTVLQKRKMNRIRKQKQREKQKMSR